MSRSRRKTSIAGIAKSKRKSEKYDKRLANRKQRRVTKEVMSRGKELLPEKREISNVYSFVKDGKRWFDADKHPDIMRK